MNKVKKNLSIKNMIYNITTTYIIVKIFARRHKNRNNNPTPNFLKEIKKRRRKYNDNNRIKNHNIKQTKINTKK